MTSSKQAQNRNDLESCGPAPAVSSVVSALSLCPEPRGAAGSQHYPTLDRFRSEGGSKLVGVLPGCEHLRCTTSSQKEKT